MYKNICFKPRRAYTMTSPVECLSNFGCVWMWSGRNRKNSGRARGAKTESRHNRINYDFTEWHNFDQKAWPFLYAQIKVNTVCVNQTVGSLAFHSFISLHGTGIDLSFSESVNKLEMMARSHEGYGIENQLFIGIQILCLE